MTDGLEVIQIIRNTIKDYLTLDDSHCYIYNNKWKDINDENLYLVLSIESENIISNNLHYEKTTESLNTIVSVVTETVYGVDFFSYSKEARQRRLEVLSFFASDLAIRTQEQNDFRIYNVSKSFVDASIPEGSKILNRYKIFFSINRKEEFGKEAPYFNKLGGFGFLINN